MPLLHHMTCYVAKQTELRAGLSGAAPMGAHPVADTGR